MRAGIGQTGQGSNASAMSDRRSFLSLAIGLGIVPLFGAETLGAAPQNDAGDEEFLQLSKLLTGYKDLNPEIAHRLNLLLSATHSGFGPLVASCASFARDHGLNSTGALLSALDAEAASFAPVAHTIIAAWYLGAAGDGAQIKIVAYHEALMFRAVNDVLTVPSYCRAAPDYWTAKPPSA